MDKDTRLSKPIVLAIAISSILGGAAFLVLDILKGSTSIVLGMLPYLIGVLPPLVLSVISRKKGQEIHLVAFTAVALLFGIVMAISDKNRSWP